MSYRNDFRSGEKDAYWTGGRVILAIVVLTIVLGGIGFVFNWFGDAGNVVQKEYAPIAMLAKYEWFINQSEAIKKMDADMKIYRDRVAAVDSSYAVNGPKEKWDVVTKQLYANDKQKAQTDLAAVISQRNGLAKDYNAQSAKFNWRPFNTRSDVPVYKFDLLQ